jgi:thiamine biosynthesis lipoprotein
VTPSLTIGPFTASFSALGTLAVLVIGVRTAAEEALAILRRELAAIDAAASRFRTDSELSRLNAAAGRPVRVSALMFEAVEVALRAARVTGGVVDPTVGAALQRIGYDRDFATVAACGPAIRVDFQPVPGWHQVRVDRTAATVRLPAGVALDLGATAKALCADRAAVAIAAATGAGVLVSLGGDLAVAGPPPEEGWVVRITHDHADPPEAGGPTVSIRSGGLATSSTSVRRWVRGGRSLHHVIDPATGAPAAEYWRTVSVAAGSCVDANIASCAAIILGPAAAEWLGSHQLPARLETPGGRVTTIAGWPAEPGAGWPAERGVVAGPTRNPSRAGAAGGRR